MADLGLLQGISEGFKSGLQNYQEQKQRNFNNRLLLADMLSKGMQQDENGNFTPTQGFLAKQQAELAKSQHDIQSYDPNSDYSKNSTALAKGLLNQAQSGSGNVVPEGMSAADLNAENSLPKTALGGIYTMRGNQLKAATIGAGMQGRNDIQRDNQASAAVDKVVNDPQLKQHTQRIQGANRIQKQLDDIKSGKIVDTSQFLGDLNTEYVNLLTGANNAALGKLERTEYRTTAGDLASVIQRISATPQSINSPQILNQLETSVAGLKQTYQKNIDTRAQQLQRTYSHNPDATAAQKQAIQDMINANGTGVQPGQANQSQPPPGGGGLMNKVKVSNGKKTLLIDQTDVNDAAKDGFQVVK